MPLIRRGPRRALLALVLLLIALPAIVAGPFALRLQRLPADPSAGVHSDAFVYVPRRLHRDAAGRATLLVQPNNSGTRSDDVGVHVRDAAWTAFERHRVADELGVVLLVPAFPRPATGWQVYTHALDRDVLTTREPALARLDLQLLGMIDRARAQLQADGVVTDARVLVQGFSASGMFANRFTALHPRRVKAATVGSPGGWPIVPVATARGEVLRYPAGIADLPELTGRSFDAAAYAAIPQLVYQGALDDNDSLDFRDGWDAPAAAQVDRLFGGDPQARWEHAAALTRTVAPHARFVRVDGVGHDRKALQARSTAFFRSVLDASTPVH